MLRHVLILARDSSGVGTLTIALDRHHLARRAGRDRGGSAAGI